MFLKIKQIHSAMLQINLLAKQVRGRNNKRANNQLTQMNAS